MSKTQLEKTDSRFSESILKRFANRILVGLLIGVSWLPFWILYRIFRHYVSAVKVCGKIQAQGHHGEPEKCLS